MTYMPWRVDQFLTHKIPPRLAMHYRCRKVWQSGEPEYRLLPILCDPTRISIDVGAAWGGYTYHMRRYSRDVIAIEPNRAAQRQFRANLGTRQALLECALSDQPGRAQLRVPKISGDYQSDLSTIESANTFSSETEVYDVELKTLDQIAPNGIGFIKIDVEGHELAVLKGGGATLKTDLPAMVIELEERHRPGALKSVVSFLANLGYVCHFLHKGKLKPVSEFVQSSFQQPSGTPDRTYINNFIFTADERTRKLRRVFE